MLRLDLICFTNSGISEARTTRVNPTIDRAQEAPEASPKIAPKTLWNPDRTREVIQ